MTEPTQNMPIKPWSLDSLQNIGHALTETAKRVPGAIAVACPSKGQPKKLATGSKFHYDTITFGELERSSSQVAMGLKQIGIAPGVRIALMVPPGIEFVKHVFALFKAGAVAILIDPGMGRKNMIQCLSEAKPQGIVGIPKAHLARTIYRRKFPVCKRNVVVGGRFPMCVKAARFARLDGDAFQPVKMDREDEAAIIFTTGSTGPPKGVLYRHRIFIQQCELIRDQYGIQPGSTDVSGFPLFALFNSAMGVTTVFPEMDPTRPAEIYPPNLIDAVSQFSADQSFGSPALWNTVSKFCESNERKLPTVKRILTAGAPVPPNVLARIKKVIAPDGDAFTPYGATEALPVASNSASVVLGETAAKSETGAGTCVGHHFPGIAWRIIEISDNPIETIKATESVVDGNVGELIVRGPVVTDQYVTQSKANSFHKIKDGDGFWHRMGDVGYFDKQGRFWFCGRKTHRVQTANGTMFTIPVEGIINKHEKIYRSALIGLGEPGAQIPMLILEPVPQNWPSSERGKQDLVAEVKELASQYWQTDSIERFAVQKALPVDIRHNSKIFREKLKTKFDALGH